MRTILLLTSFLFASVLSRAGASLNVTATRFPVFYTLVGGGPSAAQRLEIQSSMIGSLNGNGTFTMSVPARFEISRDSINYSSSLGFSVQGDTVARTALFIRLRAGLSMDAFTGDRVNFTSTSVSPAWPNITLDGWVAKTPMKLTLGTVNSQSATIGWEGLDDQASDWEYVLDQNASDPGGSGTVTSNLQFTASGLSASTTYYFHLRGRYNQARSPWMTQRITTEHPANVPGNSGGTSLAIIPNPNSGSFRLEGLLAGTGGQAIPVQVINVAGQIVWSGSAMPDGGKFRTDIALHVAPGLYTVRVGQGGKTQELIVRVAY